MAEKFDFNIDNTQTLYDMSHKKHRRSLTTAIYQIVNIILIIALEFFKMATIDGAISFDIKECAIEVALLWVLQYALYCINFSYSKQKGYEKKEYIEAREECSKASKKLVCDCDVAYLEEYCEHIVQAEFTRRKIIMLALEGINFEKYEQEYRYLNKEQLKALKRADGMPLFNKKQIKAIRRCNRAKPMFLSVNHLLCVDEITSNKEFLPPSPEKIERKLYAKKAITSILFTSIFAMVTVEPVINFSYGAVVDALLGLVPLVCGIIFGRMQGWSTTLGYGVKYYNAKRSECEQAYNWISSKYHLLDKQDEFDDKENISNVKIDKN